MHKYLWILLCCFTCGYAHAQEKQLPAEVIVIGTIHYGNKAFNHRTLYRLLQQLQPQVLLDEYSKEYKPVFGLQAVSFLKIGKVSIEQLAIQQYYRRHRSVIVRPFDTAFASRRQYIKKSTKAEHTFFTLLNEADMHTEDSLYYADYANHRNAYYDFTQTAGLMSINQPDIIHKARLKYQMEETTILPLAKKYIKDSTIVNAFANDLQFWHDRNKYMVQQIKSYIRQYPGKRIVVLTGLNHKYFLIDQLKQEQDLAFRLVEPNNQ